MLMSSNKLLRQAAGFIQSANWLQLKLFWKNPEIAKKFPSFVFRKYMQFAKSDRWRCVTIGELVPTARRLRITLLHLDGLGLYGPIQELAYLALLAQSAQARAIFEIGTFCGRTALNFAMNTPPDALIYTLDLTEEERAGMIAQANPYDAELIRKCKTGMEFHGAEEEKKIRQLRGDSMRFDFTPYHGKMDLVFVDACHHYPAVMSDTANALKMVKPGGLVIWHDFANLGDYHDVTRAVLDSLPGDQIFQIEDSQLAVYRVPK